MIISKQKPLPDILSALDGKVRVFIIGCAKCATVCKAGGEEELWQMQELLTAAGKVVTGSIVIDETCHMLRTQRDLRSKKEMVEEADCLLVMTCGAGVQSVSSGSDIPTVAGLDTLFLGNIRRFGHFEQKCSLCGNCMLTETGGICPVTTCAKGLLNGPCGGMDNGRCETDMDTDCAWLLIYRKLEAESRLDVIRSCTPPKDFSTKEQPGRLKTGR